MFDESLLNNIDYSKPMFKARSSEVFDLGDKVLKLYFEDVDDKNTDIELLNTTVAFEKGCTPMECFGKVKVNGRNGLVFKKLNGVSMTSLPESKPQALFTAGKVLATLHTMVHKQESHQLRDVRVIALDALENKEIFGFLSEAEADKAKRYIHALPEADNIIHMDFHTDNILCDGDNYQVIDWMTACRGKPECELAMMSFLFHDAELFPGSSKLKIFLLSTVRVSIYNGFIKHYCKMNKGFTADSHLPWDIVAWVIRLGVWNIESEREFISNKIKRFIAEIK